MRTVLSLAVAFLLLVPQGVRGQSLRAEFDRLFTFGDCGEPLCLTVNQAVHGQHYIPDVTQGSNNLLAYLTSAIASSVGNVPVASAASGVSFRFEGGLPVAEEVSAGPVFGERAQPLGRGLFLVGANVTGISFSSVRNQPLNNLAMTFVHQNVGAPEFGDPDFENDVVEVRADLDVSLLVTTLYASYGFLDNVDVGVVLPFVRASLRGSSVAQMVPFGPNSPHAFGTQENPSLSASSGADGSAMGLGDVGLRLKINLLSSADMGFAVIGDVRLPTGDDENFLGTGGTAFRALGVVSGRRGAFTPHLNAGYVARSAQESQDAALLTAGFDHLVSPQVTLAVDLIGSWQVGESLTFPREAVFDIPAGRTVQLTNIPHQSDDLVDLSVGAKFLTGPGVRLVTNILVPLNSGGVRPSFAWTAGLEYDFF